ncbi:MAG: bacillithiol biosynthesis protein BshC [Candidatus Omnitrophota bacterium]
MNQTIVTGQQIGLLGGPLYTTYKVLGAIVLARQQGGKAVYWLETNDADFHEINHVDYLDAGNQLRTLSWNINSHGFSCGYIAVDATLTEMLGHFFDSLRQTEFTGELRDLVLGCYSPGRTLADASRMLASELFGDFDLRLFTPFEDTFRTFSQPILLTEAARTPEGEQCNLFCLIGQQRKAVFKRNGRFVLRDGTAVNLSDHILVPNVKTRSVCQDAFFHTHTYVAGPGEVAYLSKLGPDYRFHGVRQAAIQPRMSLTLLEPRVRRLLRRNHLTPEEILGVAKETLVKQVLKKETNYDCKENMEIAGRFTDEYLERLETLGFEESDIKALWRSLHNEVKRLCGKMRAREKEENHRLLEDAAYLSDNLWPYAKPQERVFNIFYYMNLFGGKAFIRHLYDQYDFNRNIMEVDG